MPPYYYCAYCILGVDIGVGTCINFLMFILTTCIKIPSPPLYSRGLSYLRWSRPNRHRAWLSRCQRPMNGLAMNTTTAKPQPNMAKHRARAPPRSRTTSHGLALANASTHISIRTSACRGARFSAFQNALPNFPTSVCATVLANAAAYTAFWAFCIWAGTQRR
ncbi:hypothetical protein BT96DRAFT_490911 [Gymnopus androsaceus JB14]|uniref:Uncharacterized protein n=1 Tax=Gymnopus androsaceus JB14 TaxID=1447944 RepID=A0A6A4I3K0_9AGAR|nr:hypothetical protein BT96DRAFT_490911 [Gymnopus androsaceus JB14]